MARLPRTFSKPYLILKEFKDPFSDTLLKQRLTFYYIVLTLLFIERSFLILRVYNAPFLVHLLSYGGGKFKFEENKIFWKQPLILKEIQGRFPGLKVTGCQVSNTLQI